MTVIDPTTSAPSTPSTAHPDRAVAGLAARQIRRGAAVVLVVAAGMSALVTATYDDVIGSLDGDPEPAQPVPLSQPGVLY